MTHFCEHSANHKTLSTLFASGSIRPVAIRYLTIQISHHEGLISKNDNKIRSKSSDSAHIKYEGS